MGSEMPPFPCYIHSNEHNIPFYLFFKEREQNKGILFVVALISKSRICVNFCETWAIYSVAYLYTGDYDNVLLHQLLYLLKNPLEML